MKEFKITDAETGQTLLKYLSKILPLAPISLLHKSLRKKNITINHKKCSGKEILGDSDIVQIWFSDETFSSFSKRTKKYSSKKSNFNFAKHIIYEDEHIIIVNKPPGILTQGDDSGEFTLNDALLEYCNFENDSTAKPSVCNRLDRNTGGLILCGKTISGLQTLNEIIKNRSLLKKYHCIVFGKTKKEETLKSFLT
ncbi:MAG: RluA family pseudouridine synthase, partial [Dialister sp.]|nr:RluA family pseudouridine synthase [Dialister sp.]